MNSSSAWRRLCFFLNKTATSEIYTLSLHDALPIFTQPQLHEDGELGLNAEELQQLEMERKVEQLREQELLEKRSEEHTSELQSRLHLVCRLLLEKKDEEELPALKIEYFYSDAGRAV